MYTAIVKRCVAGDARSWEELLTRVYPRAKEVAVAILRDTHLAEDVVQNSLVKVMHSLGTLRDPEKLDSWLAKVVRNEAYMALRMGKHEFPGEIFDTDIPVHSSGQTDFQESIAFRTELVRSLRKLPLPFQEAVILCDLQGYTIVEAAGVLGVSDGTVKSRLSRGRERLRSDLDSFVSRPKERISMNERPVEEVLYDYLEGYLSADESARLEERLSAEPALRAKLEKQRSFLKVLHRITGRLSISAADIAEQMAAVKENLEDYQYIQKHTVFGDEGPQVSTARLYFKKPDYHRLEYSAPPMGSVVAVARDREMIVLNRTRKEGSREEFTEGGLSDFILQYPVMIKTLSENSTVSLLGKELVEGKPCYHLVFRQEVPMFKDGEMLTHIWIDEKTWFPLLEEYYDVEGNLLIKKEVQELKMNTGLDVSCFELEIPDDYKVETTTGRGGHKPRKVTLDEAAKEVAHELYILPEGEMVTLGEVNMLDLQDTPVAMQTYHKAGQPGAYLIVTQSLVDHKSIPPDYPLEEITVAGEKATYLKLEVPGTRGMIFMRKGEIHVAIGGMVDKEENIRWAECLIPLQGE